MTESVGTTEDYQRQIDVLRNKVTTMEAELAANTAITKQVKEDTGELVDAFKAAKGAWAVLEFIGKAAKPVLWISSIFTAFYHFYRPVTEWLHELLKALKGGV